MFSMLHVSLSGSEALNSIKLQHISLIFHYKCSLFFSLHLILWLKKLGRGPGEASVLFFICKGWIRGALLQDQAAENEKIIIFLQADSWHDATVNFLMMSAMIIHSFGFMFFLWDLRQVPHLHILELMAKTCMQSQWKGGRASLKSTFRCNNLMSFDCWKVFNLDHNCNTLWRWLLYTLLVE